MGFFGNSNQPLVGIDISSAVVKVLELSSSGSGYRIESFAVDALPANAVVEKNIEDIEAVGDAIKRALQRGRCKNKKCAMAVPQSAVITKMIQASSELDNFALEQFVREEANKYIPYKLEDVNLDFEVYAPREESPGEVDVLLAVSRGNNVDARVAAAAHAGLDCRVVDVEGFAVENAIKLLTEDNAQYSSDQTLALVEIGANTTSLNVIRAGDVSYSREQSFGGSQLTEEIQRFYGLSYEDAGRAKRTRDLPPNYATEVLQPFVEAMSQQVNRGLQFYYSSNQASPVDHIILAGGCAVIEGAPELIAQRTGVDVTIADPFAQMKVGKQVSREALQRDAPAMLIASGLAMRTDY